MSDDGNSQDASQAGQDAANKAVQGAKKAAELGKDVGKLAASGGTDVTTWAKLAKRYLPPIITFLLILSLAVSVLVFAFVASAATKFFGGDGSACASGASDIAVLATNGPVNVGDKVTDPVYGGIWTFKPDYMANAQAIVRAGLDYKNQSTGAAQPIPAAGIVIAIAVAFVESHLYNNPGGDRDSVGLFQQRDSWGSNADRMNPTKSATLFYNRLVALRPAWQTMDPGVAAQKVQVSAFPDRYAKAMGLAAGITLSILQAINQNTASMVSYETVPSTRTALATISLFRISRSINRAQADPGPAAPADPSASTTVPETFDCALDPSISAQPVGATGFEPGPNGAQIPIASVPGIGKINATIAAQVTAMLAKAKSEGLTLTGGSYRSNASQIQLRIAHCGSSQYAIYQMPSSSCSPPTARPGQSQHEYGLAIDFSNCSSRSTACYQWLSRNAAAFGLQNLPSEPWHWSTTGR